MKARRLKKRIKMGDVIKHIFLLILVVVMMYPLVIVILDSFKTENELFARPLAFPEHIGLENYITAIVDGHLINAFCVSLILTVVSVILVTLLGSFAAFALTRRQFKLARPLYLIFMIGVAIPYQVGIFQLYKIVDNLRLVNTLTGLILIYVAWSLPFTIFVMFGFFDEIPHEIEEAAEIDGASQYGLYAKIVMPLSLPVVSATCIYNMVFVWNDMFYPMIFVNSKTLKPLSTALMAFRGQFLSRNTIMFAGVVLVSIPMVVAFLCMQKQFIQGLTAGGVKG